ncbi:protein kinase [Lysobacter arenosi]|uniref:Protein kinase n=1 Tax=Lysobacter arenosi TaxID=2795387 RepID=A0ABX7R9W2_9GAMM|nr:WD40 repeat domain-containing serine/threonine-protein kinase [Lysobacter arenosi]QSX74932.1 protein kinase [Lysobacter arenosi]
MTDAQVEGTSADPGRRSSRLMLVRLAFGSGTIDALDQDAGAGADFALDLGDPGQRALGEYELLELIGQGGMGMVYRARHHRLERDVALKLLSAGPWASDLFVARFQSEAQHAARLQHPNIVTVYEIGDHRGLIYYAMELVEGVSLDVQLQRDGPMSARAAATLLGDVAEAVDYAHRLDVLHLDLKPGNVLRTVGGTTKIADFGLARRLVHGAGADNEAVSGTPEYMAPEQTELGAGILDRRTDVWGLGAILYELLTGQPPVRGERTPGDDRDLGAHARDVIERVRTRDIEPPSKLRAGIPADLEAICLHCLQRDPGQRYPTARALADDLTRFLDGRAVSVRQIGIPQRALRWARREPRLAAVASLAVIVLLAGVIATSLQWRRAEQNANRAAAESVRVRDSLWQQRRDAAWHQFADNDAFTALPLLVANLREAQASAATADASTERTRIGLLLDSSPRLIDVIALANRIDAVALSADGSLVAAGCADGEIRLFETASGRERWRLATADFPKVLNDRDSIGHLAFSDDGRYLIATATWPTPVVNPSGQSMMLIDVATGRMQAPPATFPRFQDATFSADGSTAILRSSDGISRSFRTRDWMPRGPATGRDFAIGGWLFAPAAGHLAVWYTRDGDSSVDLLDPDTFALQHRTPRATAWTFSPDGRQLALGDNDGGVRLVDTRDGSERRLVPQPSGRVVWLSFSADGAWLASASEPGEVHAWNVEDGAQVMPPMRQSQAIWVKIDRKRGLLAVRADNRLQVFQLSDPRSAPLPLGPPLSSPGLLFMWSADVNFDNGMIATGGAEGELRLWRLTQPWHAVDPLAAAMPSDYASFDGQHLPYVDAGIAGVVDARSGRRLGAPLVHPQPVYFAELDARANTLVTLSGREARTWDWRTGRVLHGPVLLTQTPQRATLSARGDLLAFTYARAQGRDFVEVLRVLDLRRGTLLPSEASLAGPLAGMRFSTDASTIAAWGGVESDPRLIRVELLSRPPLRLRIPYAEGDVRDGAFSSDNKTFNAVLAAKADLSQGNELLRWDTQTGKLLGRTQLTGEPLALAVSASGSRLAVGGPTRTLLDGNGRIVGRLPKQPDQEPLLSAALSADGRWVAFALRRGVQLADAGSGQPLAPPLRLPVAHPDWIASVTFADDGSSLLASTWFGRRIVWPLRPDKRPVAEIARDAQLLGAAESDHGTPLSAPLTPATRSALRRNDPGAVALSPPLHAVTRPAPARSRTLPSQALDLGAFYTAALDQAAAQGGNTIDLSRLPSGHQRFLGTDYDVRGFIYLTMKELGTSWSGSFVDAVKGIPVGRKARGLVILGSSGTLAQSRQPTELGRVVLHYRDGATARLPLIWGRDFVAFWEDPRQFQQPRLAWYMPMENGWGSDSTSLFEMRLVNPHPERVIESIDLEATEQYWSAPIFVAITLQEVAAAPLRDPLGQP